MSRPSKEKCRLCSKLSSAQAQQQHGVGGDGCWDGKRCHDRRSYYRHRGVKNHLRKQRRHQQQQEQGWQPLAEASVNQRVATLKIPAPAIPAAIAHWYRETKDSPLHALGAELWIGNNRMAKIEPIHCLGLTETQLKTLLMRILDGFSQYYGSKIERFRSSVELHPSNCPLNPCPLHPEIFP